MGLLGNVMHTMAMQNPVYRQQQDLLNKNQLQQQNQSYLTGLLGNKVDLGHEVPQTQTKYGQFDNNVNGTVIPKMEGFTPGRGLLGGEMSQPELAMKLLGAPGQVAQQTGGNLLQQIYKPGQAGVNIVGSPLKLKNGNFGYLDQATGQVKDTGTPFDNPYKDLMINNVPHLFNQRTGQITQPVTQSGQAITHENIVQQKVNETQALEKAKADIKSQEEINKAANLAEGAVRYVQEARLLANDMNDTQLGPIAGMTPNLSENSQLLEMQLNNLIGNVREKLPGILSDSDIKLLKSMIPNMSMDKKPLLKALDLFEAELQRIISKKTGVKLAPDKQSPVKWSDL